MTPLPTVYIYIYTHTYIVIFLRLFESLQIPPTSPGVQLKDKGNVFSLSGALGFEGEKKISGIQPLPAIWYKYDTHIFNM